MESEFMRLAEDYGTLMQEHDDINIQAWTKRAMAFMAKQNAENHMMRIALDMAETELLAAENYAAADMCRKALLGA